MLRCVSTLFQVFGSSESRNLLRSVSAAERRKVEKLKARKCSSTSALHKEEYVAAFIEAQGALMVRNRVAHESSVAHAQRSLHVSPSTSSTSLPAAFGAWRQSGAALSSQLYSGEVMRHCVLRGGKTPPIWSTETLQQQAPLLSKPIREFLAMYFPPRGTLDVKHFCLSYEHALRLSRVDTPTVHLCLCCVVLQRLAWYYGWEAAISFYEHCLMHFSAPHSRESVSQLLGVVTEAIRYSGASHGFPTMKDIQRAVRLATDVIRGCRTPLLQPVAVAPVLSIIDSFGPLLPAEGVMARSAASMLLDWVDREVALLDTPAHRRYLPAIAWAELVEAYARCGATPQEMQHLVDDITDALKTKHAEKLLSSAKLWSAYLRHSKGSHALDVYENNRKHFGVEEDPNLIAAVMRAVLQDHEMPLPLRVEKAKGLWNALQRLSPQKVVGTSCVFEAFALLCKVSGEVAALWSLATRYDQFLIFFGIPEDFFEAVGGSELSKKPFPENGEIELLDNILTLCSEAYPFHIPPVVHHSFRDVFLSLSVQTEPAPCITPEQLAAELLF